eukprot:m.18499 g.18499  ORF g.18499 m.18499 type:complete len:1036 (+) comp12050_c0_seq1:272-3379(+)
MYTQKSIENNRQTDVLIHILMSHGHLSCSTRSRLESTLSIQKNMAFVATALTFVVMGNSPTAPNTTREEVSFNFGWKHLNFGLPVPPPPGPLPACKANVFPVNQSGSACSGLTAGSSYASQSADNCERTCCNDAGCDVWQWTTAPLPGGGCWLGTASCPAPGTHGEWVGGSRPGSGPADPQVTRAGYSWIGPGVNPPQAESKFDDSTWESVHLPHDSLIAEQTNNITCPSGCSGRSYLPRPRSWYRKQFSFPSDWTDRTVWLQFEGVFRETMIFLNGKNISSHDCGYTGFSVRIDNETNLVAGGLNTLAVYVDPSNGDQGGDDHGSGWWYEGGGLYRHVNIVSAARTHIVQDGVFAYANITSSVDSTRVSVEDGLSASSAVVHASAEVVNDGTASSSMCVRFDLTDLDGKTVGSSTTSPMSIAANAVVDFKATISVETVELWSARRPYLYTLTSNVMQCGGDVVDSVVVKTGFRSLRYDANEGFFLNEQHFKVRGFCDHNNLAVVGMAVPDRLKLFRAQASRSIGGNGRRTSHNPPDKRMLEIYDRVGIVVMDENRLFSNTTSYVENMRDMVKRDRNHISVVIWSFCNEAGCEGSQENGGPRFYDVAYEYDGSRPTLANMFTFNDLLSKTIDVQGFSHQSRSKLDSCHAQMPDKPIFMSECCSCNTMRDEDEGCESSDGHNTCVQKSFNADCVQGQTNASNGAPYAIGTMVWTLFDYYGEPSGGWPHTTSTFGQFDLTGFPKAAAYWYRAHWLNSIDDSSPDKPFSTTGDWVVHIVESWDAPADPTANGTKDMHVYTDAAGVELFINGVSQGVQSPTNPDHSSGQSYADWPKIMWKAGNATAHALDSTGKVLATSTRFTSGVATALTIGVDVPSVDTGTGTALVLDGHDAGMVRASIVDGNGRVVHMATNNVTFTIVSGPGQVVGAHNGDPSVHLPNHIPWHPAYHGLIRGVIAVTKDCSSTAAHRARILAIDNYASSDIVASPSDPCTAEPIVVQASAPGLKSVMITIPTSLDVDADGVLAVAEATAGQKVIIN